MKNRAKEAEKQRNRPHHHYVRDLETKQNFKLTPHELHTQYLDWGLDIQDWGHLRIRVWLMFRVFIFFDEISVILVSIFPYHLNFQKWVIFTQTIKPSFKHSENKGDWIYRDFIFPY